jgi:hypothetical protein
MRTGSVASVMPDCKKRLQTPCFCVRRRQDLRLSWPVILLRGLPARSGSLRQFQADSGAGSARDEKKPAVDMSNTYADLQDFYGSDGTRTRDLRRDRPIRLLRTLAVRPPMAALSHIGPAWRGRTLSSLAGSRYLRVTKQGCRSAFIRAALTATSRGRYECPASPPARSFHPHPRGPGSSATATLVDDHEFG